MINKKNKIRYKKIIALFLVLLIPSFSFAAWNDIATTLTDLQTKTRFFGDLLMTLAVVLFFWGVVKFIAQDKKDEGKTMMIWGIVALFVMFTIWGIISFMQTSTIDTSGVVPSPKITL